MEMKKSNLFVLMTSAAMTCAAAGVAPLPEARIVLGDGSSITVPAVSGGQKVRLPGNEKAARLSERADRVAEVAPPVKAKGLEVERRVLKSPRYERTELLLRNTGDQSVNVNRFELLDGWSPDGQGGGVLSGNTDGSVAVFRDTYVGVENPMAKVSVKDGKVTAVLSREYDIRPGETWSVSYVVGRYAAGQLRREFQNYLNRERAHPYRVLPHYNSWYDINIGRNDAPWQKRMNEAEALGVMRQFREELYAKRGVFIDSYLWDDGWDNWDSLWDFHPGFPNGFRKLADEAHKDKGASIGAWMSPCGGYGGSQAARVRYAKSKGIIGPNDGLLRMSSPTYYQAFRDRVITMIRDYDMNIFKFDRMGVGHDCNGAPASHAPDMEAIVRLIGEMRAAKQDVFINATVGTWASPFWVMFADSIWRGDQDFGRKGPGRARQQWVTYRDNQIYDRFVSKAPLFPLNSLMSHGIIVTRHGPPGCEDVGNSPESTMDFKDEVWMSVACGTDLQEYYITPSLMHKEWWDTLAEGVKWLKCNVATLRDVHWVGGDPEHGGACDVYGYASLGKRNAIAILRNPSDRPQTFKATYAELFEIPAGRSPGFGAAKTVHTHDAKAEFGKDGVEVAFGPFGILLFELPR